MKKSQMTVFIILGIVIMIIFGLVSFVSRQASDVVLEKKINRIYSDFLSSTGIKTYISECLDTAIQESVELAMLQGGKIYDYQVVGGYNISPIEQVIPFNYTGRNPNGTIYNVSYGILETNRSRKIGPPPTPPIPVYHFHESYPYPGILVNSPLEEVAPAGLYRSPFAFFNEKELSAPYSLTSLCNYYGPNIYTIPGAAYTCETNTITNLSIQQYLKLYTLNRTEECISLERLVSQTAYNISKGNITGYVLMGNNDIFVSIKYPLIISLKGNPPRTRFIDFTAKPQIRVKKIHELAMHLIGYPGMLNKPKADADNIFFNITLNDSNDCTADNGLSGQPCIYPGMEVAKIKDYCLTHDHCDSVPEHHKYSDILNITDNHSIVKGKPLTFLFAIENRAPALNNTGLPSGSITAERGEELSFFALDPDEDDVSYSIEGLDGTNLGGGKFKVSNSVAYYDDVIINVTDNEKLYDFQRLKITVS